MKQNELTFDTLPLIFLSGISAGSVRWPRCRWGRSRRSLCGSDMAAFLKSSSRLLFCDFLSLLNPSFCLLSSFSFFSPLLGSAADEWFSKGKLPLAVCNDALL